MPATGNYNPLAIINRQRKSALARNAGWLLAGQGLSLAFQGAYFILLARMLGTREYGVFAGAFAFTTIVAVYSPLGTGTVFLRYVSGRRANFAPYFGNILLATSAVSCLLITGLTVSSSWLLNPGSTRLVLLAAIANCLFGQLSIELARIFQAFEKMRLTAMLNLQVSAFRTLAALIMLLTVHHASAFQWAAVSTIVSGIAAVAGIIMVIVNFGMPVFDLALARRHVAEGVGFSFASSTTSVYNDLDKTMLSHYNMNEGNGIYSVAYRLVDIASMPIFAIRDAAMPRLFQRGSEGISNAADYARGLNKKSLVVSIASSVALFASAPILPKLIGSGFSESVLAVRWLAVIPVFRSVHQMSGIVLTSAGRQGVRTAAQLSAAVLNFLLNLWLIPRHGWLGAAWASIATDGALALMNWSILRALLISSSASAATAAGSGDLLAPRAEL